MSTLAACLAVAALAGCAQSTSAAISVHARATATVTPVRVTVLYQADWSHAADGWTLPNGWSFAGGQLVNDGSGTASISIPYVPQLANYTVEVDMQVMSIGARSGCDLYGIESYDSQGAQQYTGIATCLDPGTPHHGFSELETTNASASAPSNVIQQDFVPGSIVRRFTVHVDGQSVTFGIGPSALGTLETTVASAPAHLVIADRYIGLAVSRVVITSP